MNDSKSPQNDDEPGRFPVSPELSPAEAAFVARLKAEFDPIAAEAEFTELLQLHDQGLLISGEESMARIEKLIEKLERAGAEMTVAGNG